MDGYRVFTFNPDHFRDPDREIRSVQSGGRRVVPILDPGVKREPGYAIYDEGIRKEIFCVNQEGQPYVGLVWPGETHFPDFSHADGKAWWAQKVQQFAAHGISGAWLDMNDPSTGNSLNSDMLFRHGESDHAPFHNQYANGMAEASRKGFADAHPDERPFLLCRSGYTGIGRLTALWTGDNFSNYHHLRNSIPTTLNLALSGVPFNGADVGGFGGDTTGPLLRDWIKAAFLLPFFRNHTAIGTRRQEPWAFDEKTRSTVRAYIQLRYRLRPYLYNLFVRHEESGEAIVRPLFYSYPEDRRLDHLADQLMIGEAIMQAPFVDPDSTQRQVALPPDSWFHIEEGVWLEGNSTITCRRNDATTPIFIRDRSIIPWSTIG